jgi:hypothetical protein
MQASIVSSGTPVVEDSDRERFITSGPVRQPEVCAAFPSPAAGGTFLACR